MAAGIRHWFLISAAVIDQSIVSGFNFIIGYLLARGLGPDQFGSFTLGLMVIRLLVSVHGTAVFAPMLSIGPKQPPHDQPAYFGAVLGHQALLSGALFAGCLLLSGVGAKYLTGNDQWILVSAALAYVGMSSQEFVRRYFYATARPQLALWNSATSYGLQLGAVVTALIFWHFSVSDVFLIFAVGAAVSICLSVPMLRHVTLPRRAFWQVTSRNWSMAKWLIPTIITSWIHTSTIYFVVGILMGSSAVGELHAAFMLVALSNIIPQAIENYLPPNVYMIWRQQGARAARIYVTKILAAGLTVAVLVSVIAIAKWDLWFKLLYKDQYTSDIWIVSAYGTLVPVAIVFAVFSAVLKVMEHSRVIFTSWAIMAAVTLTIAVPIVKYGGLPGAAWGAVLVQMLGTIVLARHLVPYWGKSIDRSPIGPI